MYAITGEITEEQKEFQSLCERAGQKTPPLSPETRLKLLEDISAQALAAPSVVTNASISGIACLLSDLSLGAAIGPAIVIALNCMMPARPQILRWGSVFLRLQSVANGDGLGTHAPIAASVRKLLEHYGRPATPKGTMTTDLKT